MTSSMAVELARTSFWSRYRYWVVTSVSAGLSARELAATLEHLQTRLLPCLCPPADSKVFVLNKISKIYEGTQADFRLKIWRCQAQAELAFHMGGLWKEEDCNTEVFQAFMVRLAIFSAPECYLNTSLLSTAAEVFVDLSRRSNLGNPLRRLVDLTSFLERQEVASLSW